jgi:hypothetical protein
VLCWLHHKNTRDHKRQAPTLGLSLESDLSMHHLPEEDAKCIHLQAVRPRYMTRSVHEVREHPSQGQSHQLAHARVLELIKEHVPQPGRSREDVNNHACSETAQTHPAFTDAH